MELIVLKKPSELSLIKIAARSSLLSRAQVEEVLKELRCFYPSVAFDPIWVETTGDKDLETSLRTLGPTNFFTKEIDVLQLEGKCHISIHSAKDLPDPLPKGLTMVALTKGVDPSDVIVLRDNESFEGLQKGAKIATSSLRREENVYLLRKDVICVDIRGSILERLRQLDERFVDAVVMAEAALIRLQLTMRNRIPLPGERALLQGQLAVLAREEDKKMEQLFACLDVRERKKHT